MTAPYIGPASRGPWDDTPARLCAELRARPDGWTEKDVDRICYALAYYPTGDAAIGGRTYLAAGLSMPFSLLSQVPLATNFHSAGSLSFLAWPAQEWPPLPLAQSFLPALAMP